MRNVIKIRKKREMPKSKYNKNCNEEINNQKR